MKIMNRLQRLTGILICFIVLIIPEIAQADVIWEPVDDFYLKYADACKYEGRYYSSNKEDGSVTIYKSPNSSKEVGTFNLTEGYYVSFTYADNKEISWGVLEIEGKTGWIPMSRLTLIYDNLCFKEDYQHQFLKYKGDYDDKLNNYFIIWTFPGSGVIQARFEDPITIPEITDTYTDGEDRVWGSVIYYYSARGWICLDDPANENITAFGKHTIINEKPSDIMDTDKNQFIDIGKEWILPVVLVTGVVVGTMILIRYLFKKGSSH
jgi:hypothetical protein